VKTTLEIPDALYRQAKVKAAQENRKMKDLVSEGLRLVLGVTKTAPSRMNKAAISEKKIIPAASDDQMAGIIELAEVWGVSPDEALKRLSQTARSANASRTKALAVLGRVRSHPPYPKGTVQAMIDEANRLRKESWE